MSSNMKIIVFIMICFYNMVSAQNSLITFRSDAEISVRINNPIDGAYNFYVVTNKFDINPNVCIHYRLEVNDFCSVRFELSNGTSFNILLLEGDSLDIENLNNGIKFRGSNAAGNQYLVDNYCSKGLGSHFSEIESIFNQHIINRINFMNIEEDYDKLVVSVYSDVLNKIRMEGKISKHFEEVMSLNLRNAYNSILFFAYRMVLQGRMYKFKPSVSDSIEILKKMDQLYANSLTNKNPLGYYYFFPYTDYFFLKYKMMDASSKIKILGNYSSDTFGDYAVQLLAPDSLRPILMGQDFVSFLQYKNNYYNQEKMLSYLTDNFPNSDYLPIIRKLMKKQQLIDRKHTLIKGNKQKTVFLNTNKINTLKELVLVNELKGKNIYIDIWSTYCLPCKFQFQYNDDLHELLSRYDKLVPVYISIDEKQKETEWRRQIEYYHLYDYHLRASKALYNDIRKRIYNSENLEVPRYILIDSKGSVLNVNLPRPQALKILKEVLDLELKQCK